MKLSFATLLTLFGVVLLVTISPWLYGGVQAVHQQWFFIIAAFTLVPAAGLVMWQGPATNRGLLPWAVWPLLAAGLLGALQLVPISPESFGRLSPQGLAWWSLASRESVPDAYPLSLYPWSTRRDLGLLGLSIATFIVTTATLTTRRSQLLFCAMVAINGALFSLFGIVQMLTYNGKLFWTVPLRQGGNPFAAFVNRNHAGGYLNLCVAAALACLVWQLTRREAAGDLDEIVGAHAWRNPWQRWRMGLIVNLNSAAIWAITIAALTVAGVVCSLSRGAILAMLLATGATALAAFRTRKSSAIVIIACGVLMGGAGLAVWLGQGDSLKGTLDETIEEFESRGGNVRIDHWQDAMNVAADFWRTGSGLGTYRYIYRPYESQLYDGWFYHAENQYLESLVEAGVGGLGLILMAVMAVAIATVRLSNGRDPVALPLALGGVYAVVSQAFQAFFDFGLYMPSNAMLFAAICGVCCARVPPSDTADDLWVGSVSWFSRSTHVLAVLAAIAWLGWGGWTIRYQARFESASEQLRDFDASRPRELDEVKSAIVTMHAALEGNAGNAEAHFELAQLHVLGYRAAATQQLMDQRANPNVDKLAIWQLTAPIFLHRRTQQLKLAGDERLDQLKGHPYIATHLQPAVDQLLMAQKACPILSKVYIWLAELEIALPAEVSAEAMIQTAIRLAPNDPEVLFRCGLLDLQSGRREGGSAKWRRCLSLSSTFTEQIIAVGTELLGDQAEFLAAVLPDSPERIVEIGQKIESLELKIALAEKATVALDMAGLGESAKSFYLQGAIGELGQDNAGAVAGYRRSVALEPDNLSCRYRLALLLTNAGLLDEAQEHATYCVRSSPKSRRYRDLIRRINKLRR